MYKINFQQIECFLTIAEKLNYTEAAKVLFISQPALSKQINIIEKELGFNLFIRDKRSVKLTPEGEILQERWKSMTRYLNQSIVDARLASNQLKGDLRIGCAETYKTDHFLPKTLYSYHNKYPNVNINIESHSIKTLHSKFESGLLDFIILPLIEVKDFENFEYIRLSKVQISIILHFSNPLYSKEPLFIEDLKEQSFLMLSTEESPYQAESIKKLCLQHGFSPKVGKILPNTGSFISALTNGLGVAICHSNVAKGYENILRVIDIADYTDDLDLILVWNPSHLNKLSELFIEILNKEEDI